MLTTHQLLCETNWRVIRGDRFGDRERNDVAGLLLSAVSSQDEVDRRYRPHQRLMYPLFFIPPDIGGKKLITINGVMPKTHIFSANHYELEILRLLALWRPGDEIVRDMLSKTRQRLSSVCFGKFCAAGECFEASIAALRFLAAACPDERSWLGTLMNGIGKELGNRPNGRKRHSGTTFYYYLALTDLDLPAVQAEIERLKPWLIRTLGRSCSFNTAYDKLYNPIAMYIARNCLARLPEYRYLQDHEGYAGSDGRYHLDLAPKTESSPLSLAEPPDYSRPAAAGGPGSSFYQPERMQL